MFSYRVSRLRCTVAVGLLACSFARTQTVLEIRADARVMTEANEVRIEVRSDTDVVLMTRTLNPLASDFVGFPLTVPISSRADDNKLFEVRVAATTQTRNADGSVLSVPLAQNRVRTGFRRGQVLRFSLWLLTGCRCNVETERCEPDADGDRVPECVPVALDVSHSDAAVVDVSDARATDASTSDTAVSDAGLICNSGQRICDGRCVSLRSPLACGPSCAVCTDIPGGTATCDNNACGIECGSNTPDRCPNACVNLDNDRGNCGTCGNACANNQLCVGRRCQAPPQCTQAQDPACTGMSYCNLSTRMCASGCDGRNGQCPSNTVCNTTNNSCSCNAPNRTCGSICAMCPALTNATGHTCDGNSCILSGCNAGYERTTGNTRCDDINECNTNNGGCGAGMCTNTSGSFSCSCNSPARMCGSACVGCPSDANSTGTGCNGSICVIANCAPGFAPNTAGSLCVATQPSTHMWSQPITGGPSAREGHAMVYDNLRDRIVLFGGSASDASSDTWMLIGDTWSRLITSGGPNPILDSHAMVYDYQRDRIVLFGGHIGFTNDRTWVLSGSTWSEIATTGVKPPERYVHAMAYDSQLDRIVLFGGVNNGNSPLSGTWVLSGNTWSQLTPSGESPSARYGHTMVYDSQLNRIVLFGGSTSNNNRLNDTWVLSGNTWSQLTTAGGPPPIRYAHTMAYDSQMNQVVIFGGVGSGGRLNDIWLLSGSTWSQLTPSGGPPSARYSHGMAYDSSARRMVVFGGQGASQLNDTWVLR